MHQPIAVVFTVLALCFVTACGGGGDSAKPGDKDPGETGAADVTYYDDVQPMLAQHCTRCHGPGGLGPTDFTNLDVVQAMAPSMLEEIEERNMPLPAADPDCRDYKGSNHLVMPDAEREIFAAWVEGGQALGEEDELAATVQIETALSDPDLVLSMLEPYTPTFTDASNPDNEYRCFVIDPLEAAGKYITAMAPVLGNQEMVHHIVVTLVPRDSLGEEYWTPDGWDCIDGQGVSVTDGMVGAWAPGALPLTLPEGAGLEIPEDHVLVMQMHYFQEDGASAGLSDQSGYAFNLTDSVEGTTLLFPLGDYDFRIPAGEAEHTEGGSFTNTYIPFNILGVFPHMHELGKSFSASIQHADGGETCLTRGTYEFENQLLYQYKEEAALEVGDTVEFSCTWDNSEGTEDVQYGERTDEEMCFFFTLLQY